MKSKIRLVQLLDKRARRRFVPAPETHLDQRKAARAPPLDTQRTTSAHIRSSGRAPAPSTMSWKRRGSKSRAS